jgi:RNA polymerase sigma factor (sigma-70 family)
MPRVSKEKTDELELIRRAQSGDGDAMMALLKRHRSFIKMLVNRITYPDWVAMEDVMQEANIGMMTAIKTFDLTCKNKLITYAFWIIKRALTDHMSKMGYMATIPFLKLVELKTHLNKLERDPNSVTEAERKSYEKFSKFQLRALAAGTWSFDAPNFRQYETGTDTTDDDFSAVAALAADAQLVSGSAENQYVSAALTKEILELLAELPAVEGVLVCQYLGIYFEDAEHNKRAITGKLTVIEDGELVPGVNGFGVQIGRSYNQISKDLEETLLQLRKRIAAEMGDVLHDIGL